MPKAAAWLAVLLDLASGGVIRMRVKTGYHVIDVLLRSTLVHAFPSIEVKHTSRRLCCLEAKQF